MNALYALAAPKYQQHPHPLTRLNRLSIPKDHQNTPRSNHIDAKPLPQPGPQIVKQQRTRRHRDGQKRKYADPPAIAQGLEQRRREQRDDATEEAAEDGAGSDGRRCVLAERIDVIILHRVKDDDLADAVEESRADGDGPREPRLHRPGEGEEGGGDEDAA